MPPPASNRGSPAFGVPIPVGVTTGNPAVASMTGFARRRASTERGELAWEIRSVNAKGLDVRLRYPPGYEADEAAFRTRIAAIATRGSVQAVFAVTRTAASPRVRVNGELLGSLIDAVATATSGRSGLGLGSPTLDGLLAIRGVVEIDEGVDGAQDSSAASAEALALLDAALEALHTMRAEEGEALRHLLLSQLDALEAGIEAAEQAPGRTPRAMLDRLTQSVTELLGAAPALDPARLHQEAVLLAMRADVREEIDRLRVHAGAARALLIAGGPVGRRLDFLAQELAREASTLCSKSNDGELTAIGLSMRNRIEQLREQVQNLE